MLIDDTGKSDDSDDPVTYYVNDEKKDIKTLICLIFCLLYKESHLPPHLSSYLERLHLLLLNKKGMNDYRMWDINLPKWSCVAWDGLKVAEEDLKKYEVVSKK
jgi:hypothetical protein